MVSNIRYFTRRMAEEESRAARAITPAAAARHAQLAQSFRQRLEACAGARA
jgi:hypothetical protein